jgi:hypothetical protein
VIDPSTKIYSNKFAFAALKADGSITAWGGPFSGGTSAPSGSGYTKIYSIAKSNVSDGRTNKSYLICTCSIRKIRGGRLKQ